MVTWRNVLSALTERDETKGMTRFLKMDFGPDLLKNLLGELYKMEILSIMVEGGAYTLRSFISEALWDEARIITGNIKFREGVPAPVVSGNMTEYHVLRDKVSVCTEASNPYLYKI